MGSQVEFIDIHRDYTLLNVNDLVLIYLFFPLQTSGSGNVDDIELLFGQTRGELTQLFEQLNRERNGQVSKNS